MRTYLRQHPRLALLVLLPISYLLVGWAGSVVGTLTSGLMGWSLGVGELLPAGFGDAAINDDLVVRGDTQLGDAAADTVTINADTITATDGSIATLETIKAVDATGLHLHDNSGSYGMTITTGTSGDNTILTLIDKDANDTVTYDGAGDVITASSGLAVNGNTTLGDVTGDTVTINADTITATDGSITTLETIKAADATGLVLRDLSGTYGMAMTTGASGDTVVLTLTDATGSDTVTYDNSGDVVTLSSGLDVQGNATLGNAGSDTVTVNADTVTLTDASVVTCETLKAVDATGLVLRDLSGSYGMAMTTGALGDTVILTLTDKDASDTLTYDGGGDVITATSGLSVNGNVTIGNAAADAHVLNGTITHAAEADYVLCLSGDADSGIYDNNDKRFLIRIDNTARASFNDASTEILMDTYFSKTINLDYSGTGSEAITYYSGAKLASLNNNQAMAIRSCKSDGTFATPYTGLSMLGPNGDSGASVEMARFTTATATFPNNVALGDNTADTVTITADTVTLTDASTVTLETLQAVDATGFVLKDYGSTARLTLTTAFAASDDIDVVITLSDDDESETLTWDDGDDRFEFSDDLAVDGALASSSLGTTGNLDVDGEITCSDYKDDTGHGGMSLDAAGDATFHNNVAVTTMLDTPDIETATVSARDGTLAQTLTDSTGCTTLVTAAVTGGLAVGTGVASAAGMIAAKRAAVGTMLSLNDSVETGGADTSGRFYVYSNGTEADSDVMLGFWDSDDQAYRTFGWDEGATAFHSSANIYGDGNIRVDGNVTMGDNAADAHVLNGTITHAAEADYVLCMSNDGDSGIYDGNDKIFRVHQDGSMYLYVSTSYSQVFNDFYTSEFLQLDASGTGSEAITYFSGAKLLGLNNNQAMAIRSCNAAGAFAAPYVGLAALGPNGDSGASVAMWVATTTEFDVATKIDVPDIETETVSSRGGDTVITLTDTTALATFAGAIDVSDVELSTISARDGTLAATLSDSTGNIALNGVLDASDAELATVSARDGALALTLSDSTGNVAMAGVLDVTDVELDTVSARDGTLAQTVESSTGKTTLVTATVSGGLNVGTATAASGAGDVALSDDLDVGDAATVRGKIAMPLAWDSGAIIAIDFTGYTGTSDSSDNFIYMDTTDYWRGDGLFRAGVGIGAPDCSVDEIRNAADTGAPDLVYGAILSETAEPSAPAADHVHAYVDSTSNDLRAMFDAGGSALVAAHPSTVIHTISADETLSTTNHIVLIDADSNNVTLTLPAVATTPSGTMFTFKVKTAPGANVITIDANASEHIDGAETNTALDTQYEQMTIVCDGTEWWIL